MSYILVSLSFLICKVGIMNDLSHLVELWGSHKAMCVQSLASKWCLLRCGITVCFLVCKMGGREAGSGV